MGLQMPRVDGLAAIEQIRAQQPDAAIVILTTYNEDERMGRGLRAGARGDLLKDTDREMLLNAIGARRTRRYFTQAEHRVSHFRPRRFSASASIHASVRGDSQLNITERSVKTHPASIFNRLRVNSRTEAAVAIRLGLVQHE